MMALELWTGPRERSREKQCQSIVVVLCGTGPLGGGGLLRDAVAVPDVRNPGGEGRARHPVGNSPAGQWPGRSEASSANTDYNQMSQASLSLLWLRSAAQGASPPSKGTRRARRGYLGRALWGFG